MSFYFRLPLFIFLLTFCFHSRAVQVQTLHTSLCNRYVGITLFADKRFAYFLNTDGEFQKVPRYQILGITSYSLDHFPLAKKIRVPQEIPYIRLWALNKDVPVILAEGFVLGSNLGGIQVFTLTGSEIYINKDSIWKVEIHRNETELNISNQAEKYTFQHPQQDACKEKSKGVVLHPTELITDPISIKRKFDQQIAALKIIENYDESQTFYAVPQIYTNKTSIGYWLPLGNRHGSSEGRVTGIAPLIRNEYSAGPFSFQHLSLTGAGPVPNSIHEEPQTMLYYGFKASYLHFAGFIDPSLILAGSEYQWKEEDLGVLDDKIVESSYLALGFDRGPFSVTFFLASHVFGGFKQGGAFQKYEGDMFRLGLNYQTPKFNLNFNTSLSNKVEPSTEEQNWDRGDLNFYRVLANYKFNERLRAEAFYFNRELSFKKKSFDNEYQGTSNILGVGSYYHLTNRIELGSRLSMEKVESSTVTQSTDEQYIKLSLLGSMNY
ncbi:MAG TPA: hypothetical protein VNJ01_11820 [Bacteriovoracaceae bacterium]|nr:hypothetical protein [Bacteriovoracaceae bacterium]